MFDTERIIEQIFLSSTQEAKEDISLNNLVE